MLDKEELNRIFEYKDGCLYWKVDNGNGKTVGKEVGTRNKNRRYLETTINNKTYLLHRVIWTMFYGDIGDFHIDHINRNSVDNRIENLRLAEPSENQANRKNAKNNTTGVKGVFLSKYNTWVARVAFKGKRYQVGSFSTLEEAEEKLKEFREKLHGEFYNHG